MSREGRQRGEFDYTPEERQMLASLRRSSGRTCRDCQWYSERGRHKGCFPHGKYRKFLSKSEYESGCDLFKPVEPEPPEETKAEQS